MELVEKILRIPPGILEEGTKPEGESRIISIASGKGGVGKTSLAINLGIALSQFGRNVLVIDADLGLANVNVMLGIVPKYNLSSIIQGNRSVNEVITETEYGISIIAGASGFLQLAEMPAQVQQKIIERFLNLPHYDDIIIDLSAGISTRVINFLKSADIPIIITTPEPTAITDAYGIIKVASSLKKDIPVKLVVNRVHSTQEAKTIAERVVKLSHQFLGIKVEYLGYMPEDKLLQKSVILQKPVMILYPKSKISNSIKSIANKLLDIKPIEKTTTRFVSFLRRLIGG